MQCHVPNHAHSRAAISVKIDHWKKMTTRRQTPCQPYGVQRNGKYAGVEQASIAKPKFKSCTKHDKYLAKHTSAHSRAASPLKINHWTKVDSQEQHAMSATWGAAQQTNADMDFDDNAMPRPIHPTKHDTTLAMPLSAHSRAASQLKIDH